LRTRGFSLLEFVVVVVSIAILAGLLLERVLPLIGQAERVAFEQVRAQLKSALLLEAAERITRGESESLNELAGGNPIELLLEPPGNYVGSFYEREPDAKQRRIWYFDSADSVLVYRPGPRARISTRDGRPDRIEHTVRFAFRDQNGDGAYQSSVDHFDGLKLELLTAYEWAD
jgi:type II secretory pathway pseudopilin PulG